MKTYLVTGGAGFIGSHIVAALVERGDRVRVLDNFNTGKRGNVDRALKQIELIEGDLIDRAAVDRAVQGVEVVFHQAALASVPRSVAQPLDTNAACVTGTLNILDAARQSGVRRVVYAASSSAYGDQPVPVKSERLMPAPISPYAAAKLAGEFYCQAFTATYGLETVALRYFNVFGPRQDPQGAYAAVIPKFITDMLAGRQPTIFGDGKQSRDFVFVGDVVRANLLAAESANAVGKVVNIASGRQYSLLEVLAAINRVLGTQIKPILAEPRVGDVRDSLADISLAKELLDYEPSVSFDEGLRRTIDDFRASGRESRK
jgi:UDP-glucose 4-epimerase